ncbi:MAG: hypothetical protein ACKOV8_04975 [Phycisphaerales bacterium]
MPADRPMLDHDVRTAVAEAGVLSPPRLRALAELACERALRVVVLGTAFDARRAASCGVRVAAAVAPPLGAPVLGRTAIARAIGSAVRGAPVLALGERAVDAVRAAGARPVELGAWPLPRPARSLDPAEVRGAWGVQPGDRACLLVASPPRATDARVALDVVGRAAVLGRPITLVAHPDCRHAARAAGWSGVAGGAWRIVLDERADDPELLAGAVDVGLALDAAVVVDELARPPRGSARWWAAIPRSALRAPVRGDAMGAELLVRAGVPMAIADGTAAAAALRDHPRVRTFNLRRPNLGALAVHAVLGQFTAGAAVGAAGTVSPAILEAAPA